ncbi:MAG: hypothetical protein JWQ07_5862 [Ramlibacter sp.]|nr:hypothetical protein [Ramlibacter sp.]
MQLKGIAVVVSCASVAAMAIGLYGGSSMATVQSKARTEELLSHARFLQGKERATLVRFLEEGQIDKSKELLYIVLAGNLRDFTEHAESPPAGDVCEIVKRLGRDFVDRPSDKQTSTGQARKTLVEQLRKAASGCT